MSNGRFVRFVIEKLMNMPENGEGPRADMYLPVGLMVFGIFLVFMAIVFTVVFFFLFMFGFIIAAIASALVGVLAIICWRNQTIRIIDDERFEYSTFLGKKTVYAFSDIKALKRNADSMTLYVGNEKVHIESIAIMTPRFKEKMQEALNNNKYLE